MSNQDNKARHPADDRPQENERETEAVRGARIFYGRQRCVNWDERGKRIEQSY